MRKNKQSYSQGFTLIEILIVIIIVSVIAIISTNLLQSSLKSREFTNNSLTRVKKLNLASNLFRRDLRQALNVPMKDIYGNPMEATFFSPEGSNRIIFTALINRQSQHISNVRRIEYAYDGDAVIRRQYFAANPYSGEDFFDSILFNDVEEFNLSFSDGSKWFDSWPKDELTRRNIPKLVQIQIRKNDKSIEWMISPKNDYAYPQ